LLSPGSKTASLGLKNDYGIIAQPASISTANPAGGKKDQISGLLLGMGHADAATVVKQLASRLDGLSQVEANARLKQYD